MSSNVVATSSVDAMQEKGELMTPKLVPPKQIPTLLPPAGPVERIGRTSLHSEMAPRVLAPSPLLREGSLNAKSPQALLPKEGGYFNRVSSMKSVDSAPKPAKSVALLVEGKSAKEGKGSFWSVSPGPHNQTSIRVVEASDDEDEGLVGEAQGLGLHIFLTNFKALSRKRALPHHEARACPRTRQQVQTKVTVSINYLSSHLFEPMPCFKSPVLVAPSIVS
jgi:hypothetical protein